MAELLLVRHAQAAFGTDDYDRLTALGHSQARWLGDYFMERGMRFDRVLCGTLRRHRETLEAIAAAGVSLAQAHVDSRLDEYDPERLVAAHLAAIQHDCEDPTGGAFAAEATGASSREERTIDSPGGPSGTPLLENRVVETSGAERTVKRPPTRLVDALSSPDQDSHRKDHFRLLRAALTAWTLGRLDAGTHRTYEAFQEEAYQAFQLACRGDPAPVSRALIVTSGGPISSVLARHLGMPSSSFIALNLQVRNSGFCEIRFNARGAQLVSFNNVPHLDTIERRRHITFS